MEETVKTTSILVDGLLAATGYRARAVWIGTGGGSHISHLQARGGLLRQARMATAWPRSMAHGQQEEHFAESRDCHMEQAHGASIQGAYRASKQASKQAPGASMRYPN